MIWFVHIGKPGVIQRRKAIGSTQVDSQLHSYYGHTLTYALRVCRCEKAGFFMSNDGKKKFRFRFPVWAKTLTVLLLSVITMSVVAVVYSANKLKSSTQDHYINKSEEMALTLARFVDINDVKSLRAEVDAIYDQYMDEGVSNEYWDSPEREAYLAHFESVLTSPAYLRLLDRISEYHAVNDALWTYIAYADFENQRLIYLVDDAPEEERCLPGCFDDFTEQDKTVVNNKENGFEPEITNFEQYQYVASTGKPIYVGEGRDNCYAMVDLSMDAIVAEQNKNTKTLTIILLSIGFGVIAIGYLLVALLIVRPIRILTKTANQYVAGSNDNLNKFAQIRINTKDEIEDLSNSMKKMEADLNHYIADLFSTTSKLEGAEKKADELKYIADRDALTGLMNKRAYFEKEERLNIDIKNNKAKFAVCMIDLNDLKVTNDSLGHEKGDILIVTVANIIKKVFALSSCYRVGGDEFVVIAENEDLKNLNKLVKLFKTVEEESRDDVINVSAAIGVATFEPGNDNNVEDVFKRADRNMYANKKAMKEKGQ